MIIVMNLKSKRHLEFSNCVSVHNTIQFSGDQLNMLLHFNTIKHNVVNQCEYIKLLGCTDPPPPPVVFLRHYDAILVHAFNILLLIRIICGSDLRFTLNTVVII